MSTGKSNNCDEWNTLATSMCDNILNEMDWLIPKNNIVSMHSFLHNLTSRGVLRLIKSKDNYIVIKSELLSNYNFYGQNKCVIILPIEGIVVVTTLDIAMNISGIRLWYTNPELTKKIRRYDIYDTAMSLNPLSSPQFIVSCLPSDSLTLVESDNIVVTLADIVSKYVTVRY